MAKVDRLELHEKLKLINANVYFQPPSNVQLTYPCIIYRRSDITTVKANDSTYLKNTQYQLTVIERDADGVVHEEILDRFPMSGVDNQFVVDNLYHTIITLYYK